MNLKSNTSTCLLGAMIVSVSIGALGGKIVRAESEKVPAVGKGGSSSSVMGVLELEHLDKRRPVPLAPAMANHQKQNMREHLEAVQAIISGLSKDDFVAVEKAARRMGYSEEMKQMCTHMGAGAPGFTELAINFHKTADTIAEAARFKDRAAVLKTLDVTLQTCTGCHSQFRQQIVEGEATHHRKDHGK